jgi:hypothetical protein
MMINLNTHKIRLVYYQILLKIYNNLKVMLNGKEIFLLHKKD